MNNEIEASHKLEYDFQHQENAQSMAAYVTSQLNNGWMLNGGVVIWIENGRTLFAREMIRHVFTTDDGQTFYNQHALSEYVQGKRREALEKLAAQAKEQNERDASTAPVDGLGDVPAQA